MGIEREKEPCWLVTCDNCEEGDMEEGGTYHYGTQAEALEAVRGNDWHQTHDGKLICLGCAEDAHYTVACPKCSAPVNEMCPDQTVCCLERIEALVARHERGEDDHRHPHLA